MSNERWSKTWDDQPDEVMNARPIGTVWVHHGQHESAVEIRRKDTEVGAPPASAIFYLTAGNLFGSETVRCEGANTAMTVLGMMGNEKTKKPMDLPGGAKLLEGV